MIHWGWTLIAFAIGVAVGFALLAFMAACREEKNEKNKYWWEE